MGAFSWTRHLAGTDLQRLFADAADDDRAEYGSDGYSGSISNADGVEQATGQICHPQEAAFLAEELAEGPDWTGATDSERRERADASATRLLARLGVPLATSWSSYGRPQAAHEQLPTADKWGCAYAIPVGPAEAFKVTQRAIPLDLTSLGLSHPQPDATVMAHLHEALAAQLGTTPRIADVQVLDDSPRYTTTVKATEGPVVTRYRVYARSGPALSRVSGTAHPSVAAARAELTALVKDPPKKGWGDGTAEYVVLGEKVRDGGQPLVIGRRELASRLVIYTVTLVSPRPTKAHPLTITGWHAYGVSPC